MLIKFIRICFLIVVMFFVLMIGTIIVKYANFDSKIIALVSSGFCIIIGLMYIYLHHNLNRIIWLYIGFVFIFLGIIWLLRYFKL